MAGDTCKDFKKLKTVVEPTSQRVPQCVELGDEWVHLRACLLCGQVGCCDRSKNQHGHQHWNKTRHALIRSQEPGETWRYCYVHNVPQ